MTTAAEIAAYEADCSAASQPIWQKVTIDLCDIREVLSLASALSISLSATLKEFSEAVDRDYSSSALGEAVSFRLQRDAFLSLKRIYEKRQADRRSKRAAFLSPNNRNHNLQSAS